MGEENPLIYLLGGGSLSLLVAAFIKGAWDYIRGRHDRERETAKDRRDTISQLKDEVRAAERDADEARMNTLLEQRKSGTYWEAYAKLRQHIVREHHVDPSTLGPWPKAD